MDKEIDAINAASDAINAANDAFEQTLAADGVDLRRLTGRRH